jgi:long-chain acyl-CoA synthetase
VERIWLQEYPKGVPAEVDFSTHASLKCVIEECCRKFADRRAFTNMGVSLTYAELERLGEQFGSYLRNVAGLERGDRLALMMPNVLQYPICVFGAMRSGIVIVNVNPMYTPRELEHQLSDSGAKAIVVVENFAHTLQQVLDRVPIEHVILTGIGDMFPFPKSALTHFVLKRVKKLIPDYDVPGARRFRECLAEGARQPMPEEALTFDDIAFLQYTGGTTGVSKGAVLTHGNMVSNLLQAAAWLRPVTHEGQEVLITALPLYHIFALLANCLTYSHLGAENILITNPRDCDRFVATLKKIKFTGITGVNTLFNSLLNTPGFSECDFSHLGVTLGGGMAVQRSVAEKWREVTGKPLIEAYGLTETSPAACMNPMTNTRYNGSIGVPLPSTDVTIRNDEGIPLPIKEAGEICIRGPQVMRGYWNQSDETEKVMIDGEWLRTGDVGRMDERGYIYIEDRKKDMILVSGFNVYPNEVESVAMSQGGILEAAAIGIPHEKSGEIVKLFVVRKDPSLTEADVLAHCRENLSAYKVPKVVEFRESLPKSNVGKILRRALRDT